MAHGTGLSLARVPMLALACACLMFCLLSVPRPVGAAAAAVTAPNCNPCFGVDVSQYQGVVNWSSWKARGKVFAYIRATQGSTIIDSEFSTNYTAAYHAGIIRGAYTFANPRQAGGAAEADFFVAHGGRWSPDGLTLPGALDIETGTTIGYPECWGLSAAQIESFVGAFVNEYHARTTRWPVIYFNAAFWTDCTGNYRGFTSTSPEWVAATGVSSPPTVGWPFWTFWQYGQSGTDLDEFSGSGARLETLATNGSTPPPTTPTPTPRSTATPTPTPTPTPRSTPTATPRSTPTATPRSTPAATPRSTPTATPTSTAAAGPAGSTPAPAGSTPAPAGFTPAPAGSTPAPAGSIPMPPSDAPGLPDTGAPPGD